jgi:alkanesulfonate monooxygenase SsuD/methylene tetrahydromethanopterin reductase-like flavin-dependent oxidoreductase (luciferase family)
VRSAFAPGSICYKPYLNDGTAADRIDDLLAQARAAEAAGFDGVTVSEHHLGFPGYFPSPVLAVSWILEHTSKVWAAPAPMLALLRPTALVAEEIAWLAARFPGRVGAGFAAGSILADFELVGSDQSDLVTRFERALQTLTDLLSGDVPEALRSDPAFDLLRRHPLPVISAASSFTACRRAARVGCGILLESAVRVDEVARMIETYRSTGGRGPVVLVRRVWVGDSPPVELERARDALVRETVPDYNRSAWLPPEAMIISGDADEVAEELADVIEQAGADALNLRVHIPGISPHVVVEQIERLEGVLPIVRDELAKAERP